MRIVLHGQQAFGKAVLERLLERGEDVVAVCCAPTKEGKPEDPLAELAREKGLPLHQPASWKTPEALELMKSFKSVKRIKEASRADLEKVLGHSKALIVFEALKA